MVEPKTELGKFLRKRRLELRLTQSEMENFGMRQNVYARFETGNNRHLKENQVLVLATALKCDQEQLRRLNGKDLAGKPKTEFGKFVRNRRLEIGLSLLDFAKRLGCSSRKAVSLETSRSNGIKYKMLAPLSKALEIDPANLSRFLGNTGKQNTQNELGQRIRDRRKEFGISLTELAKKLGITNQSVSQIENGICTLTNGNLMIERIAGLLELDVTDLCRLRRRKMKNPFASSNSLGGFLAAARLRLHLSQELLAKAVGVSVTTVSNIETNKNCPKPELVLRLEQVLRQKVPGELLPARIIKTRGSTEPAERQLNLPF